MDILHTHSFRYQQSIPHQVYRFDLTIPNFSTVINSHHIRLPCTLRQKYASESTDENFISGESSSLQLFKLKYKLLPAVYASSTNEEKIKATEARKERIRELLSRETKGDRLRRMYSLNEFGIISPELKFILTTTGYGFLFGIFFGSFAGAARSGDAFKRQHATTPFESEHLARRKMNDKMLADGMRSGFRRGMQLAICTSTYLLVSMTIANYNNRITVYENTLAGAVMGALYKWNFGLRGMFAASLLGGVLGTINGALISLAMKFSGYSFDELRYYQHEYYAPEIQAKLGKWDEVKTLDKP